MKTQRFCLSFLAALVLLSSGMAFACMQDRPARAQIVIKLNFEPHRATSAEAPEEYTLQGGDLVTLELPRKALVTAIQPKGDSDPILVELEEARYLTLSDQGGGKAFLDGRMMGITIRSGPGTDLRRFGAAHAGHVYLRVSYAGRVQLIRLDIAPAKEIPRGHVVLGTEATVDGHLALDYYDSLEIELPGEPGDGWSTTPAENTGFKLTSIEAVDANQAAGAPVHRVRLRFTKVGSKNGSDDTSLLEVKSGTSRFIFRIEHLPTPLC